MYLISSKNWFLKIALSHILKICWKQKLTKLIKLTSQIPEKTSTYFFLFQLFITLATILNHGQVTSSVKLATTFEQVYFHRKKNLERAQEKKKRNICVLYDFAKLWMSLASIICEILFIYANVLLKVFSNFLFGM